MIQQPRQPQFCLIVLVVMFVLGLSASRVLAGQVVTLQLKSWARQTVAQEKALMAIAKPQSIAVLYFANPANTPALIPLQKGLAVMLITDLTRLDVLTVIERTQLQALVEELGFGQSGLVDPASAPRIGRLLQTEFLIGGQMVLNDSGRLDLSATLLEVGPARVITHITAQGTLEQIFDLEKQLFRAIVAALQLDLSPKQEERLAAPLAARPEAALAFFEGIEAGDRGKYEEAFGYYQSALVIDPGFDPARQSLGELTERKLVKGDVAPPLVQPFSDHQARELLRGVRNKTSFTTGLTPSLPDSRINIPAGQEDYR